MSSQENSHMTSKSRTLWSTVAVIFATAVAIATLSAQDSSKRGGQRGPGRGFGPLPILQRLDLTDAQREQIRALLQERRTDDGSMKKVGDLQRDLNAAIFADTPDTAKIDQLKAALTEAEAAALTERVDLQLRVGQILTPEQRQKARELPSGLPRAGRGPIDH
jgi:Spy/CpxP family protein refolding chaperone